MTDRTDALEERRISELDHVLTEIASALGNDTRVAAAWLAGSIGRGTNDWLSDLDLWIVVRDEALPAIRADPWQFVASIRAPMLVIDAPGNAPDGGVYLFTLFSGETGPHQVDWYWLPAAGATRPAATRLLFDYAGIPIAAPPAALTDAEARERLTLLLNEFVAMAAIAGKLIARGWTLSAAGNLRSVHQLLAEIEWIIEHNTRPEHDDIKECVRDLPVPASSPAALADLTRLLVQAETLRDSLGEHSVTWPGESIAQVRAFLLALNQR